MNPKIKLVALFAILILSVQNSYAAFPVKNEPPATSAASQELMANNLRDGLVHQSLSETRNHLPAPPAAVGQQHAQKGPGLPIASFVCGLVGLFVAGIPLGTLAIIFGAISMGPDYERKGLALAGLIIGVVAVIGALIAISTAA